MGTLPNTEQDIKQTTTIERPRICCFDIKSQDIDILKDDGLNIYNGSLGKTIELPLSRQTQSLKVLPNQDFPANLHEYDIFILDLDNNQRVGYNPEENHRKDVTGSRHFCLQCSLPETIFDPRPGMSNLLKDRFKQIKNRRYMVIAFACRNYDITYTQVEVTGFSENTAGSYSRNIYDFFGTGLLEQQIHGFDMTIKKEAGDFHPLLAKHIEAAKYNQTFKHAAIYNSETDDYEENSNFLPLLVNHNHDITSFFFRHEDYDLLILPQFQHKGLFLSELLKEIAPAISPALFPFSKQNSWKLKKDYWLPNEKELALEKQKINADFEKQLQLIDEKIQKNRTDFSFLHNLLTETGDDLVDAVIEYLTWLGFAKVIDMDKEKEDSDIKEEDVQIVIKEGLIIMEVKGIGGTSTDSECSQISKIKHRRCKERNAFDVFALYLVNHQRYLPPLSRRNPPFTKEQKTDALSDERGLLSTWQLYNLYFDIENGIITKEEARNRFIEYGLVTFRPKNLVLIDEPEIILKKGTVCIVNLDSINLKLGDELFVEKNGQFSKATILSIQDNDEAIDEASSGEIGIELSAPIKRKSKLWKKDTT